MAAERMWRLTLRMEECATRLKTLQTKQHQSPKVEAVKVFPYLSTARSRAEQFTPANAINDNFSYVGLASSAMLMRSQAE